MDTQLHIYEEIIRRHNRPKRDRDGVVICGAYGRGNAGVMSVSVLVISMASMLILSKICTKFKLDKLEQFAMPLSMFIGMGSAMLISAVVPADIANFVWR